jgi:flavin reductase (DIM6/NTAB) family NADH-FMN oxidoreductase RutF
VTDGFRAIEPKILYFGTPVALISSQNEDGSTNLAPISSFWALGWTAMLGLLDETKTADNLAQRPECVVNIPSPDMWQQVEKLAPLTGKNPVPEIKARQFRFEPNKFDASGLSPMTSEVVKPERAKECPVHLEARVVRLHTLSGEKLNELGGGVAAEVEVASARRERVHPGRQPHRSGEMVAIDLQLPALLPARGQGVGEDISRGTVRLSYGCLFSAAASSAQ